MQTVTATNAAESETAIDRLKVERTFFAFCPNTGRLLRAATLQEIDSFWGGQDNRFPHLMPKYRFAFSSPVRVGAVTIDWRLN